MFLPKSCLPFFGALPLPLLVGSLLIQASVAIEIKPLCSRPKEGCQKTIPSSEREVAFEERVVDDKEGKKRIQEPRVQDLEQGVKRLLPPQEQDLNQEITHTPENLNTSRLEVGRQRTLPSSGQEIGFLESKTKMLEKI